MFFGHERVATTTIYRADARVGSFGEQEGKRCFRFVAPQVTKALIARGAKRRIRGGGATLFRQVQPFSTVDEDVLGNLSLSTGGFGFLGVLGIRGNWKGWDDFLETIERTISIDIFP